MKEQEETKAIWKTIKGSQELFDLYGYYPTLHDASVTDFDVKFENREIVLTFEYSDLVGDEPEIKPGDKGLATKIVISWLNVSEAKLQKYNNDIYHISFQKLADGIKTDFSQSFGIGGYIISDNIEVVSVELSKRDSIPNLNDFLNTVNFMFS